MVWLASHLALNLYLYTSCEFTSGNLMNSGSTVVVVVVVVEEWTDPGGRRSILGSSSCKCRPDVDAVSSDLGALCEFISGKFNEVVVVLVVAGGGLP